MSFLKYKIFYIKESFCVSVEKDNSGLDDIWIGLTRNTTNQNFYWRNSGLQLPHEGSNRSIYWYVNRPNSNNCTFMDFGTIYKNNNTVYRGYIKDRKCTKRREAILCEMIF